MSHATRQRRLKHVRERTSPALRLWLNRCIKAAAWVEKSFPDPSAVTLGEGDTQMMGVCWFFPAEQTRGEYQRIDDFVQCSAESGNYEGSALCGINRVQVARRAMMDAVLFSTLSESLPTNHGN